MHARRLSRTLMVLAAAGGLGLLSGCSSYYDDGYSSGGSFYYGAGFHDPWYYGDYDGDIVITPPPRPERPSSRPHPSQPIARPPRAPRPMPSIPSAPRGGGGRGR